MPENHTHQELALYVKYRCVVVYPSFNFRVIAALPSKNTTPHENIPLYIRCYGVHIRSVIYSIAFSSHCNR